MLTFLDLCSGIGGGRLGLELAGFKCIGYSDTSRLAKITYNLMHDTTSEFFCNNIKKLTKEDTPNCDVIIAGFPCQAFSVIGRKDGFNDKRGQIIFKIADIIAFSQPKYFILENVKGLVTHDKGKTLTAIISTLEKTGYKVHTDVLTTLDYGIPQNRKRIYFVGIRNDLIKYDKDFRFPMKKESTIKIQDLFFSKKEISDINLNYFINYLQNRTNNNKYSLNDILQMSNCIIDTRMNDLRIYKDKMPTLRAQRDGIYYVNNKRLYQLTGAEALLYQGFPVEKVNLVKDIVSDRHLLMQAGNAMSVNVIKEIGLSLQNYINEN
jgi:DNA (cytosine-5)-methyltransferase 1